MPRVEALKIKEITEKKIDDSWIDNVKILGLYLMPKKLLSGNLLLDLISPNVILGWSIKYLPILGFCNILLNFSFQGQTSWQISQP